jgi:MSHA biogenesis protein MshM
MKTKQRFGLHSYPFPKNAKGKTFFEATPGYQRLGRAFGYLVDEPGLGVVTAEPGVGKTAAIRNLCSKLPQPDYLVIYLCNSAIAPLDLYRGLAIELGIKPSHRRAQLWADLKKTLLHLVDERGHHPILVVDEAQHLSDIFLLDLSGFLNFAFDSRELFTIWLVGFTPLTRRLRLLQHAALRTRVTTEVRLEPLDRETFGRAVAHGFEAAGATSKIISDQAVELLFRSSRGVFRAASQLIRAALRIANERDQSFLDETIIQQAIDELSPA